MKRFCLLLGLLPAWVHAGSMTEIVYQDSEPGEAPYLSRILAYGDMLRLDYGVDAEDYTLFDRKAGKVYVVAHGNERITEIGAAKSKVKLPKGWRLDVTDSAPQTRQLSVNGRLCLEVRSAPLLPAESRLLADLRRALAKSQAAAWQAMPEDLRDPCYLAVDGTRAGFEYEQGLALSIRYADGRGRSYRSHVVREAQPELFELPAGYKRFILK